jgi:Rieske Fe-S protein
MSELTRRQFCVVTGAGLVAGACGSSGASGGGEQDLGVADDLSVTRDLTTGDPSCPVNGKLDVGPASQFAVGKTKFFACARLFILRDATGIYAMTAVCTHDGCTVNFAPATHDFECPCHMSTFDFNGAVTNPPAPLPLVHFACALDPSGNVVVDTNTTVPSSTRLSIQD